MVLEDSQAGVDPEEKLLNLARGLAAPELSWPAVSNSPIMVGNQGRFAKAFPLSFPMGIADLFDHRTHRVGAAKGSASFSKCSWLVCSWFAGSS